MKVHDVMTHDVVTIGAAALVSDAMHLMLERKFSGLPVVEADGTLVGIVTEGNFMHRAELGTERQHPTWLEYLLSPGRLAHEYVDAHARRVAEVMTRDLVTIDDDAPLAEGVRLLEKHHIKRLPVIKQGRLVGVLSRADLLRAYLARASTSQAVDLSDAAIHNRINDELCRESWSPRQNIAVSVQNGVVELRGVLTDERTRIALRVLVENVPGVKGVLDHLTTIEPHTGFVVHSPASAA